MRHPLPPGGIGRADDFLRLGWTPHGLRRGTQTGELVHVRSGVYASALLDDDVVAAARVGGALTGIRAARASGLWIPPAEQLDVVVPRGARALRNPHDATVPLSTTDPVRVLWRRQPGTARTPFGVASLPTVLRHVAELEPPLRALPVLDSALHQQLIGIRDLRSALASAPPRVRGVVDRVDARAEAGTETVLRVALADVGIVAEPQHRIPETRARIDLRVGDRLLLECDSEQHHGSPGQRLRDLRRDAAHTTLGYLVQRYDWWQVTFELPRVVAAVQRTVGLDLHWYDAAFANRRNSGR